MSEDITGQTNSGRSFEERVFIRFDAIDTRLGNVEARLEVLEARSYDTKPIWERALAEIAELRESVNNRFDTVDESFANLERKFDVQRDDMTQLRADQKRVNRRVDKLEGDRMKPS